MALASLIPHHIFGLKASLRDALYFVDDTTVIYPAGHNLVFWSTDQKSQKIISGTPDADGISAIALTPNRKQVAVAEHMFLYEKVHRGSSSDSIKFPLADGKAADAKPASPTTKEPFISIFDTSTLKKRKVLPGTEIGSREYVAICFTSDSKMIAALGGGPDWTLVLWSLEKQKVAATAKVSFAGAVAYQVLCCPANPGLITIVGVGFAKTFKATETSLRPVSTGVGKRDNQVFLCHTWLKDNQDSDSESDVLDKDNVTKDGTCIYSLNNGELLFVDGGEVVTTIPPSESIKGVTEAIIQHSKGFLCGESNGIVSIYEKQEGGEFNYRQSHSIKMDANGTRIKGMALSPNEDMLVCAMENNQLLAFPFQNLDMVKPDEVPKDIIVQTFHSDAITGMAMCIRRPIIATCSVDKSVRIWNYIEKCCEITTYFPKKHSLFRCIQMVKAVVWSYDDNHIYTGGIDGAVYEWEIKGLKRVRESVIKGCLYSSIACVKDVKNFFAVGSDRKLKELDDSIVVKSYTSAVVLTRILLPFGSRLLFVGTEVGSVRAYRYPLSGDYYEVRACSAPISRIAISSDGMVLACAAEDGSLMLFDVRDKERSLALGAKKDKDVLGWSHEVLTSKADIEELRQSVQDLEAKVVELAAYCEYQLKLKEQEIVDRIKEITSHFQVELEESRLKLETALQQKAEEELELEQKQLQLEENHAQVLQDVEDQYQKKMMVEVARFTQLEQEKILQDAGWQEQFSLMQKSHEKALQDMIEAYEDKLDGEKAAYVQLKKEKEQVISDFAEVRRQHEEDQDQEIEVTKISYEAQLSQEKDVLLRIKGENGIMKKKLAEFHKDLEAQREEIGHLFQQKKELYEIISIFERDTIGLKKDIQERDETIGEKEKRIYDLKRKNQELEKFKFVLDFKIKDLKQQVEPRELELQKTRDLIDKMETELGRYHTLNVKKDLSIAELKLQLSSMDNEAVAYRRTIADLSASLKHFQHDFHDLAKHIQDFAKLKSGIIKIFEKYVDNKLVVTEVDKEVEAENARQRLFLERTVSNLQKKLNREIELNQIDHYRMINANAGLVKEINEARNDLKAMRSIQSGGGSGSESTTASVPASGEAPASTSHADEADADIVHELNEKIQELRADLAVKMERIRYLENQMYKQETIKLLPNSKSELPPLDIGT